MNLSHIELVNYCKNLVAQSIHIEAENFFRMDITEIQGAMRTAIGYPCFALESHDGDFEGSTASNSIENKRFAFTIFKNPTFGDFDEQNLFLDDCEIIGKKFLARMRYDARQKTSPLFNAFTVKDVYYQKVGPIYTDHLYGYRFQIELKPTKVDLKTLPADWNDITTIC